MTGSLPQLIGCSNCYCLRFCRCYCLLCCRYCRRYCHRRDLKASPNSPYGEAPDETVYRSYSDSDVAHLKQRIVRAEAGRAQMAAKLQQVGGL